MSTRDQESNVATEREDSLKPTAMNFKEEFIPDSLVVLYTLKIHSVGESGFPQLMLSKGVCGGKTRALNLKKVAFKIERVCTFVSSSPTTIPTKA